MHCSWPCKTCSFATYLERMRTDMSSAKNNFWKSGEALSLPNGHHHSCRVIANRSKQSVTDWPGTLWKWGQDVMTAFQSFGTQNNLALTRVARPHPHPDPGVPSPVTSPISFYSVVIFIFIFWRLCWVSLTVALRMPGLFSKSSSRPPSRWEFLPKFGLGLAKVDSYVHFVCY